MKRKTSYILILTLLILTLLTLTAFTTKKVVAELYFGDSDALEFQIEKRKVADLTPEILITELIKGPKLEGSTRTIPEDTKLIWIKVIKGTAYVNFSKELIDNHWGGSAGENITVYSIVNTLTKNKGLGIKKVKFLVEGNEIETLAGHLDLTFPIAPK